jgi:hypothetical protein
VSARRFRFRDMAIIGLSIVAAGGAALWVSRKNVVPPPTLPVSTIPPADAAPPNADAREAAIAVRTSDAAVDSAPLPEPTTLAEQRTAMLAALRTELDVSSDKIERVRAILEASPIIGQGNPKKTVHPMTRAQCREIRARAGLPEPVPSVCGDANMVPIDGAVDAAASARICIDQY